MALQMHETVALPAMTNMQGGGRWGVVVVLMSFSVCIKLPEATIRVCCSVHELCQNASQNHLGFVCCDVLSMAQHRVVKQRVHVQLTCGIFVCACMIQAVVQVDNTCSVCSKTVMCSSLLRTFVW